MLCVNQSRRCDQEQPDHKSKCNLSIFAKRTIYHHTVITCRRRPSTKLKLTASHGHATNQTSLARVARRPKIATSLLSTLEIPNTCNDGGARARQAHCLPYCSLRVAHECFAVYANPGRRHCRCRLSRGTARRARYAQSGSWSERFLEFMSPLCPSRIAWKCRATATHGNRRDQY